MSLEDYMNSKTSIYFYPVTQAIVERLAPYNFSLLYKLTRNVGLLSEEHILSSVRPGKRFIFEYFLSFDPYFWISIILSLIIVSLLMTFLKNTFKAFLDYFWLILSVLLSETIPKRQIPNSPKERILLYFWFIFCTIILLAFSGVLLGFFIRNPPNHVIDSWDELFMEKEFKIITSELSFLKNYVEKYKSSDDMARDFNSRIDMTHKMRFNRNDLLYMFKNITTNSHVFVGQMLFLRQLKSHFNKIYSESLHVSKYGGGISPYFIPLHKRIDSKLEIQLNSL